MNEQRRTEIRVGVTVIAGLLVLLLGFTFFKEWRLSGGTYTLAMRFENSSGLQPGDPVMVNGVRAGKVSLVKVDKNTVLVKAEIDQEYQLTEDAVPTIQMLELMAGKKVEIRQGASARLLEPGTELRGAVDPDISGAFGVLGSLRGKIEQMAEKANTLLDNSNGMLGDKEFTGAIKQTVTHLEVISRDMQTLIAANKNNVNELSETLTRMTRRVDTMLVELRPKASRGLDAADRLAGRADSLLTDVHDVVTQIRDSKGLLHKVLSDSTLNPRLDRLFAKLDTVTQIIIDGQLRIKLRL
jgi:phospholipid/cholesterol/gamma-HCH transport system substrate-binding protein